MATNDSDSRLPGDNALTAPAAERNKDAILAVLRQVLPQKGLVLEIASGTGQHVVHLAEALPELTWQPSDPDASMRDSIHARIAASGAAGIAEPLALDACAEVWPIAHANAVLCINMIHIAPWSAAEGLMRGAGQLLDAGSPLILYGPFRRGGRHTSASNEAFDAGLKQRNAEWGVRDIEDVSALAQRYGLRLDQDIAMPANNRVVIFIRATD